MPYILNSLQYRNTIPLPLSLIFITFFSRKQYNYYYSLLKLTFIEKELCVRACAVDPLAQGSSGPAGSCLQFGSEAHTR